MTCASSTTRSVFTRMTSLGSISWAGTGQAKDATRQSASRQQTKLRLINMRCFKNGERKLRLQRFSAIVGALDDSSLIGPERESSRMTVSHGVSSRRIALSIRGHADGEIVSAQTGIDDVAGKHSGLHESRKPGESAVALLAVNDFHGLQLFQKGFSRSLCSLC